MKRWTLVKQPKNMVLSLKIFIAQNSVTKTFQFDPQCLVYDACKNIREKIADDKAGKGLCMRKLHASLFFSLNKLICLCYNCSQ